MSPVLDRTPTGRPTPGEFADYAAPDIAAVEGDDAIDALREQGVTVLALLDTLTDAAVHGLAYAPGKWTLREVVGHLIDDERIFAYRLLCVARGEEQPLAGFDEKVYAANAGSEERSLASLAREYRAVRESTIALLEGLPADAWRRRGTVNGYQASPRGLAFHIAGHELRHLRALREKYLGRGK